LAAATGSESRSSAGAGLADAAGLAGAVRAGGGLVGLCLGPASAEPTLDGATRPSGPKPIAGERPEAAVVAAGAARYGSTGWLGWARSGSSAIIGST